MTRSTITRLLALALLLGAVVTAFLLLRPWLTEFHTWAKGFGIWGLVLIAAAYFPVCLVALPATPLTLGAGWVYGVVPTTIAISIGSTLGASLAFLVGRYFARGWVEKKIAAHPKFQAIDRAIGAQGFKIVLMLRLTPLVPFNLLNYGLALTRVSFRDYVLASWIGMLPGTLLYAYLGSAFGLAVQVSPAADDPQLQAVFWGSMAATVLLTVLLSWYAKKTLTAALAAAGDGPPARENP
jgi:uncharacterized membrane protein YdjX (TVP38/TMEM64 family)